MKTEQPLIMKARPMCQIGDCHKPALCYIYGRWLCGDHVAKYMQKIKERSMEIMIEE